MAKILLGFMGAGKTTIGRLLDPNFHDLDELIVEEIGMPIADFFACEGEAAFRQIETSMLERLLGRCDIDRRRDCCQSSQSGIAEEESL